MLIAVLIYGRLHQCAEHYNNIVECLGKQNDINFFFSSDNSPESLVNDFITLYKPILYNNNPIHYDSYLEKYPGINIQTNDHSITCHFMNKNRVFSLLEEYINKESIQYDVIVSMRIDCIFHNNFIFNNLEDNTVYIPVDGDYGGINDQIAYGKVDVMKKYNSINIIELLDKKLTYMLHPETLTLVNINFNNLLIKRVDLQYKLDRVDMRYQPYRKW